MTRCLYIWSKGIPKSMTIKNITALISAECNNSHKMDTVQKRANLSPFPINTARRKHLIIKGETFESCKHKSENNTLHEWCAKIDVLGTMSPELHLQVSMTPDIKNNFGNNTFLSPTPPLPCVMIYAIQLYHIKWNHYGNYSWWILSIH